MEEPNRPWNRQPWDTAISYGRFLNFYLPMRAPRTIDQAYRNWRKEHGKPMTDPNVRAPNHWWYWANGKDPDGLDRDIPDFMSWQERAQAWDDYQDIQKIAAYEREREEKRQQLQQLASGAFYKLITAWNRFDPARDDIRLGELVHATRVINEELRKAYDLQVPDKVEVIDWKSELVQLIKDGRVTKEDVASEIGEELARELFDAVTTNSL